MFRVVSQFTENMLANDKGDCRMSDFSLESDLESTKSHILKLYDQ